jgi:hypothetical protein
MRARTSLSGLVALLALALPGTASASNVTVGGTAVFNLSTNVTSTGQSFTVPAGTEGFLHTLRLSFRPATGQSTFHVFVSALDGGGLPTGTPLYTSGALASPAAVTVATTVYPNVTLTPGTQYAFFVDNTTSGQILGNFSSVYSGGRQVVFVGGAWALGPTSDLNFRADFSTGQRVSTTSLACTAASVEVGATTTCTATVADAGGGTAPTGTVNFADSSTASFTPASCTLVGGTCAVSLQPGVVGAHTVTASYSGTTHLASSGATTVTATTHPTSTAVGCTPAARSIAAPSTCAVTVTNTGSGGTPTGSVSFASNASGAFSSTTCTLSAGTCAVDYVPAAVGTGTHTVTGTYGAAASFATSSGTDAVAVSTRTTATSTACAPTTLLVGATTTCTATATDTGAGTTSTPGGTVAFTHTGAGDLSAASCTLSAGSCSVGYTPSAAGTGGHAVTAGYSGDALHAVSSGSATIAIAVPLPDPTPQSEPTPLPTPLPAPPLPPDPVPSPGRGPTRPTITHLTSDVACLGTGSGARRDITVRYTTTAAATTTFTVERRMSPSVAPSTRCPANLPTTLVGDPVVYATASARHATRIPVRRLVITRTDAAGAHRLKLLRAFDVTSLRPGRYRLRIAPVAAEGAAGPVVTLSFWVLAPAKATHKH